MTFFTSFLLRDNHFFLIRFKQGGVSESMKRPSLKSIHLSSFWRGFGMLLENGGFLGIRWGMCVDFCVGDYDRR